MKLSIEISRELTFSLIKMATASLQVRQAETSLDLTFSLTLDFGSAKKIVEEKGKNDSIRGTPYWMAPETIKQAGSGRWEERVLSLSFLRRVLLRFADIWSIGCTVIEMATAKPPLADKSPIQAMFHIANATDPPAIPSELSQECRDFTSQCLK